MRVLHPLESELEFLPNFSDDEQEEHDHLPEDEDDALDYENNDFVGNILTEDKPDTTT
jgi:hypothetical protein